MLRITVRNLNSFLRKKYEQSQGLKPLSIEEPPHPLIAQAEMIILGMLMKLIAYSYWYSSNF